ncbi:YecA family protein [Jeotgalibacillus marinus]|uniref:SEC-C metal-binding domain-containing protein n=1 Tax=Jeotgalibacillus marinus TaxID=86667 RepID=A0ABV3Q5E6_9BACL
MQDVGRNEPCPCGSGKKFKKCCAQKKVVSIRELLVTEQMDMQLKFLNEVMVPKQGFYKNDLTYILNSVSKSFDEPQFLTLYLTFMFGLRQQGDATHWSTFLNDQKGLTARPRMRDLMAQWHEPKPVMAEVVSMDEETREIVIKDLIDDAVYTVILPEFHSWATIDYLYAVLLPFEDKWVPYGFMFPAIYTENERSIIVEQVSKLTVEGEDRSKWLDTEMIAGLINAMVERDASSGEWLDQMVEQINEEQGQAVGTLKEFWDKRGDNDLSMFACHIAASYFAENGSKIRKPQTYLAAVSYLMAQHATDKPISQKEAGEAFGTSPASVSKAVRKIEEWFLEELKGLLEQS